MLKKIQAELSAPLWKNICAFAKSQSVPPAVICKATFAILLHRYFSQEDLVIGESNESKNAGFFITNSFLSDSLTFPEFLKSFLDSTKKSESPRAPVPFAFSFGSKNPEFTSQDQTLGLQIQETGKGADLCFSHQTDLFSETSVSYFLKCYENLLQSVASRTSSSLTQIPLLSPQQAAEQVQQFSGTDHKFETCNGVHELFEKQVDRSPDAVALEFGSEKITYRELDQKANRLAHFLRAQGISGDQFVGLCMERSIELYVAIYAILKAGGAYVPLDPEYPQERLNLLIEDIQCSVILTQTHLREKLPQSKALQILAVDGEWQGKMKDFQDSRPGLKIKPESLAYMIYTSGSTGKPKGCANTHQGIANYIQWSQLKYPMGAKDKIYHKTPFTFDSSVPEILWPLMAGASAVIAKPGGHRDAAHMIQEIAEKKITCVDFTPSMLQIFLEQEGVRQCSSLRVVTVGGEALAPQTLKRFYDLLPKALLANLYGPTEAAVVSTYWDCRPQDAALASIPIGYPLPNTRCYILEPGSQSLAPIGMFGELYLGGVQVAREYWKRPDLTADRFVADPFSKQPKARMYKTGDRARILENGVIEFQGRLDFQVKVRGFRVELGEIEVAMLSHPNVVQTAVVLKKLHGDQGPGSLVAYWTDKRKTDSSEIRDLLKKTLPEYMIPAAFIHLESFPQTTSGKIDRQALMKMKDEIKTATSAHSAPIDETEKLIASAWEIVLHVSPIGRDDNYFSLGGDSLGLIQILHLLKKQNLGLELKDLYDHQTVAELGTVVRQNSKLGKQSRSSQGLPGLTPATRSEDLVASTFQERLFFLQKLNPGNSGSNTLSVYEIAQNLNIENFQASLKNLIQRNEILRTHFKQVDDRVFQIVTPASQIQNPIQISDFSYLNAEAQTKAVTEFVAETTRKPFDLEQGPLYRFHLLKLAEKKFQFFYVIHHIIYDGDSETFLQNDLAATYNSLMQKKAIRWPEARFQYADFAAWERKNITESYLKPQKDYWSQKLANSPDLLNLPLDFARPPVIGSNFKFEDLRLSKETWKNLRQMSREQKVTPSILGMAVSFLFLHRYSADEDICIGSAINRRTLPELQDVMGPIINSIVLRSQYNANASFQEHLGQIANSAKEAYLNADVPLDQIFKLAKPTRNMSYAPLYQASFTFAEAKPASKKPQADGLELKEVGSDVGAQSMDLVIQMVESQDGEATLTFRYNADLFRAESVRRMLRSFETLFQSVIANPQKKVGELEIVSASDRQELLGTLAGEQVQFESCNGVHELFERQVDRTPDALALEYADQKLTYRELDQKANQLASYLRQHGVAKDVLVGLCMERSIELYVAIYAVLKAGGAYVPLDPEHPQDRLAMLIDDINCPVIISQERLLERLPKLASSIQVLCMDRDWKKEISSRKTERPNVKVDPQDLAYIFFTSGSTGKPKGCANTHQGIANYILWLQYKYPMTAKDKLLQKTPFTFDVSLPEVLSPLMQGASVAIAKPGGHKDPAYMTKEILERHVTHIRLVPSMLQALLEEPGIQNSKLRYVSAGGETLPPQIVKRYFELFPRGQFVNSYGPTEAAVVSTYWNCEAKDAELSSIPIGRPLPNTTSYILDPETKALVPAGVWGELYLGGVQLAREYWKRPDLTAASFIADHFAKAAGARLYKTGDRARFLPGGAIEFQGRLDFQVKVRGFRVELGEIEVALQKHPNILQAVVVLKKIHGHQAAGSLVAYWIEKQPTEASELRDLLKKSLPEYMVPSAFVRLESLPQTSSGKVDRKALMNLKDDIKADAKTYSAPIDELEKTITSAWEAILHIRPVSRDDNYFALGGDSLGLIRLLHNLKTQGLNLELKDLYTHQTVMDLGEAVRKRKSDAPQASFSPLVAIPRTPEMRASSFQERLYFLQKLNSETAGSNTFSLSEINANLNFEHWQASLRTVIQRNEILRTHFKQVDDHVMQVVTSASEIQFALGFTDVSRMSEQEQSAAIQRLVKDQSQKPFDLDAGPLYRFHLVKRSADRFCFLQVIHHIIIDGDSMDLFRDELLTAYESLEKKKPISLAPPAFQYADFAAWERQNITDEYLKSQKEYWGKKLASPPELINMPLDYARPPLLGSNFKTESLTLSSTVWNQLRQMSREQKVTPSILGLAVCFVFLHRYSGDEDICVGTPINRRVLPELRNIMGPILNSIVLRSQYNAGASFKELLAQTAQFSREAYLNADLQLDQIFKLVKPARNLNHAPLYQVVFDLFEMTESELNPAPGRMELKSMTGDLGAQDMDLAIRITEEKTKDARLLFRYNADLFQAESIQRMLRCFENLLKQFTANPNLKLAEAPLLSKEETARQLERYSGVQKDFGSSNGVHGFFEKQVDRTPNALALEYENQKITYRELDQRANQLAHYLRAQGVGPDVFVGLCMERSIELYVAIYAVLKAGGAYAPLDPEYPQDRLAMLIEDIECPVILTQAHLMNLLPKTNASTRVLCMDRDWKKESASFSTERPGLQIDPESLAYMIYTSGSTGKPKGCANTHVGITNYVQWTQEKYPMGSADKLLHKTPFTFDVSVPEVLWPLMKGASVAIAKAGGHRDSAYMVKEIRARNVTHIRFVPSMLQVLLEEDGIETCTSLKVVIVSGEALPTQTVKRFYEQLPNALLVNLYGPTEAAVDCTYWDCDPKDANLPSIPIGHPIPNTTSYVLDPNSRALLPVGVWGELYLGGIQLAREYWKRPDLTPDRFVADPFSKLPKARMYKTGDRARFLENGAVEFQGRLDFQVKVRGFRIELGEVEVAVLTHPNVVQAAVVMKKIHGEQSSGSLVAYWVDKKETSPDELRELLKKSLPEYMVPSAFIRLETIPQTTSGKIDRKVLMSRKDDIKTENKVYNPPVDDLEKMIAAAWEKVLRISPIGRDDNYFGLGGDSLGLIRILHELKNHKLGLELKELYVHQTVAAVAAVVRNRKPDFATKSIDLNLANIPDAWKHLLPKQAEEAYLLTGMQSFMISHYGQDSAYHFQQTLRFEHANLSADLLAKALLEAMKPHPVFQTVIVNRPNEKFQVVMKKLEEPISFKDLSSLSSSERAQQIEKIQSQDRKTLFDLNDHSKPLWRAQFLTCGKNEVVISFTLHHAIMDGWSLNHIHNEWQNIYEKWAQGKALAKAKKDSSYKEFVALEKQTLQQGRLSEFWSAHLKDAKFSQPNSKPQLAKKEHIWHRSRCQLKKSTLQAISALSKDLNVSVKAIFLHAFFSSLQQIWHMDGLSMALVTNGRSELLSNPFGAAGLFWNYIPYFEAAGASGAGEKLQATQRRLLELEEGSGLPFSEILQLHPKLKDIAVSFNFTDFDRFAAEELNQSKGQFSYLAAQDQFHFPMNCFVGLDARGDDSLMALNVSDRLMEAQQLHELMEKFVSYLVELEKKVKRAA